MNRSDKRVSVFGGTGFIGGNFCNMYKNETITVDRNIRKPFTNQVLYLISTIHNYNVFDNPYVDIETNLRILIETLEQCKDQDVVFNFVSSWFVYGQTDQLPAKEDTNCNPKGFYSITKRCAEQLLISYCETFNIQYRILRLCNVYGVNATKVSIKRNALQYLASEVVHGRDINLYNAGSDVRDFMHVDDVSRAMMLCIEKAPLNEIINGEFTQGTGDSLQNHSWTDLYNKNHTSKDISNPSPRSQNPYQRFNYGNSNVNQNLDIKSNVNSFLNIPMRDSVISGVGKLINNLNFLDSNIIGGFTISSSISRYIKDC